MSVLIAESAVPVSLASPISARRRVCHVSLGLATGGLERLLVDFARFHDREQYELHFVALHDEGRPAAEIRAAGCEVHVLHACRLGRWRKLARLSRLLARLRPDIVHTHNAGPHFHGTLAARLTGTPVVIHTRHGQHFGHGGWSAWQFRQMARGVDRVVAVSADAADLCRRVNRLPAKQVDWIWNGIDLDRFKYRGPAEAPVAISVARLSPEKDLTTLLRAVPLVLQKISNFRLQIVGQGDEFSRLDKLRRDLGLVGQVDMLGERRDVPELLAKARLFVSSSLTEGISLTLLEAMAVGLPIVATAVGGNTEVVDDGVTGRLVPPSNPAVLAEALVQLCQANNVRAVGRRSRARVEEHFDIREMLRQYENIYAEVWRSRMSGRVSRARARQ